MCTHGYLFLYNVTSIHEQTIWPDAQRTSHLFSAGGSKLFEAHWEVVSLLLGLPGFPRVFFTLDSSRYLQTLNLGTQIRCPLWVRTHKWNPPSHLVIFWREHQHYLVKGLRPSSEQQGQIETFRILTSRRGLGLLGSKNRKVTGIRSPEKSVRWWSVREVWHGGRVWNLSFSSQRLQL